ITTAVPGEPFWIDDGARNIYFYPSHVQELVEEEVKKTDLKFVRPAPPKGAPLPVRWELGTPEPWDNWERKVSMTIPSDKKVEFKQRITQITPDIIKIEADRYDWPCYYKTKEVSPALLRKLLYQHFAKEKDSGTKEKDIEY